VEDEPLIRFAVAEALRDEGASVVEAATADEAWEYLTGGDPVDLIFTDHRMPGAMSGAQLAARVRQNFPYIAIVIASGDLDQRETPESVLKKPYSLNATAGDLVRRALAGRQK
jgi:CheY-like chemotaxis protein